MTPIRPLSAAALALIGLPAGAAVTGANAAQDRNRIKDLTQTPPQIPPRLPAKIPPASEAPAGARQLPHAGGRTFATLDAYLAYLRDYAGPTDRPWYREVRPGLFRLETGNLRTGEPGAPPRLFTREELERRFGFAGRP